MPLSKERRNAAPLLFLFAGLAFLAVARMSPDTRPLIRGTQLFTAALFFLAAYLHHRRSR